MSEIRQSIETLKRFNENYVNSSFLRLINGQIWKYPEFCEWPGSIGKHHSYKGGLLAHTAEVFKYAITISSDFEVDMDILFTSILWHDLAKIFDYKLMRLIDCSLPEKFVEKDLEYIWIKSDYHSNIHHITGSIAEFTRHALDLGLDRCTLEKIQHCMAGHHGYPEWRSPVTPKSLEAIICHQADMLSATYGKTK